MDARLITSATTSLALLGHNWISAQTNYNIKDKQAETKQQTLAPNCSYV
jgi:hypothetical protein